MRAAKVGLCGACALFLCLATVQSQAFDAESFACAALDADDDLGSAAKNPVTACNNTCPPHIKSNPKTGTMSDLPGDGWVAWLDAASKGSDCKVWIKRIGSGAAREVGPSRGYCRTWFTEDGKWLMYYAGGDDLTKPGSVFFARPDGSSGPVDLKLSVHHAAIWYRSPKQDISKGMYEIVVSVGGTMTTLEGYLVDCSSGTPKLGAKRTVGTEMKVYKPLPFALSRDRMVFDYGEPLHCYTIPDNGLGITSYKYRYPVPGGTYSMCAGSINQTGEYTIHNVGKLYYDCLPGNHKGPYIAKFRHYNEPRVTMAERFLDTAKGAVSINWAPAVSFGFDTRGGSWSNCDWNMWYFTNHPDWLVGTLQKSTDITGALYFINWKANLWIPYSGPRSPTRWPSAYIEGAPATGLNQPRRAPRTHKDARSRGEALAQWGDLLGRQPTRGASAAVSARGVAVGTGATRVTLGE